MKGFRLPLIVWCLGLFLAPLMEVWAADAEKTARYGITMVSSLNPIRADELPDADLLKKYHIYTTQFTKGDQLWYRLRAGFFASYSEASSALNDIRGRYDDAWINKVSDSEYKLALANRIVSDEQAKPVVKQTEAKSVSPPINDEGERLIAAAREKLTGGDTAAALPLLNKVLTLLQADADAGREPQLRQARLALELLGVTQERLGQVKTAMATYKSYLSRYKEGPDADRVRQRLAVLETATAPARKAMPEFKEKTRELEWSGSFSQFSSRDIRYLDGGGTDISSQLFNDLGISSRYQGEAVDIRTQFDTSYRYTFNADNSTDDQLRLSTLFADFNARNFDGSARIGRQSSSRGGVLGRFDGVSLSYRALPRWKYNLVAGYPVELSSTSVINETDRHFAGLRIDMGTFAKAWDISLFGIDQMISGITDRQAVGGELRYSNRKRSHLILLDYDTSYHVVNSILALSNWFLPSQTSINLVLDSRTVPVMATSNALIGRTETSIDELLAVMSEDEVRQLARDRTSRSYSATLGVSHPLSEKYQLNAEVSAYNQTDTKASGGVQAVSGGAMQYYYSVTMIGSSVFKQGDISILGIRYADTDVAKTSSVNLNVRYPLTNAWRIGPSLVVDYRNSIFGVDQITTRPSVRIDYRWLSNISFDAQLSLLNISELGSNATGDTTDVFFELGYRVDF